MVVMIVVSILSGFYMCPTGRANKNVSGNKEGDFIS